MRNDKVRKNLLALGALAGAAICSTSALAQPANDSCATAIPLMVGLNANLSNVDATPSTTVASCGFDASFTEDVWYTFTVPAGQSGLWSFDTSGSSDLDDTVLSLYETCGGPELACDDDSGDPGFQSLMVANLVAGQTYRIRVGGYQGAEGVFDMVIAFEAPPPVIPSDECATATVLALGNTLTDMSFATNSGNVQASCAFDATYVNDVYFSFDPPAPGDYYVQIGAGNTEVVDTVLSVYPDCTLSSEIACNDDDSPVGIFLSALTFNSPAGDPVIFRVGVTAGDVGLMDISVQQVLAITNDECVDALPISTGTTSGTSLGSSNSGVVASCGFDATFTEDVWYSFTPSSSGSYVLDTEQSTGLTDTVLSVYDACGGNEIACDDDNGVGLLSRLTFTASTPNTYLIRVAGYNGSEGTFVLNLAAISAVPNDECATASTAMLGANASTSLGSTSSGVAASCAFDATYTEDVWFVFTAASNNVHTFNTNGSTGLTDTVLSIYDECNGAEIACDDDSGTGLLSSAFLQLTSGEDYFIRVAGGNGSEGAFTLNITDVGPGIANDSCAGATPLTEGSHMLSSAGAVPGNPTASCSNGSDTEDVWFSFMAPAAGFYQIDTNGSVAPMGDTTLSVFSGPCGSLTELKCDDDSGTGLQSQVRVSLAMNQTVLIRVAGFAGAEGAFILNIAPTTPAPGQVCEIPVMITPGTPADYDSTGDINDLFVECSFFDFDGADAFFVFTPSVDGDYDITMTPSPGLDAVISVISGCTSPTVLACGDEFIPGVAEQVTVFGNVGVPILIRAADGNGDGGEFTILAALDAPGACCTGTSCSVETQEDCEILNGSYQGNASTCVASVTCAAPCDVVQGAAAAEAEACQGVSLGAAASPNGSCATAEPLAFDSPMFGNMSTNAGFRDLDYYQFTLTEVSDVTVTVNAEFAVATGIVGCSVGYASEDINLDPCETSSVVVAGVPAGTHALIVTSAGFYGIPCDGGTNNYLVTIALDSEPTPCERADFDGSGTVDATDIFIFLDAWFAQNGMTAPGLSADTDGSGTVDATDIFIYLDLWFANNGQTC